MATIITWDAQSISRRIVDRVRAKTSWAEILDDASDRFLIDAVSDEVEEYARENEYLSRERKWSIARSLSSMVAGAKGYDYKPHRKIGATGNIEVSANPLTFSAGWNSYTSYSLGDLVRWEKILYRSLENANYNQNPANLPLKWERVNTNHTQVVGLAKWSAFTSTAGLPYVSTTSVNLTPSMDYVEVPVIQGTYRSVNFTALGKTNEEFFIESPSIESSVYEVLVDDVLWSEVGRLVDAEGVDRVFETEDARDFSGVYFKFGDDVDGKRLSGGSKVTVRYIETDGSVGNVTTQNSITTVSSAVFDVTNTLVSLACSNTGIVTGGKNYETVDEIRDNAISHFHAGTSLAFRDALQNYLAKNFSFIGKCIVWGSYETNVDAGLDPSTFIPFDENYVFIAGITPGQTPLDILKTADGTLTNSLKNQILADVATKKGLTDLYDFKPVEFIPFRINASLSANPIVASLATLRQTCDDTLQEAYNIEKMNFKDPLYSSDILPTISNLEGVHHHATYLEAFNEEEFTAGAHPGTPYTFVTLLKLWAVRVGSIRIVLVNKLTGDEITVAIDDATNSLLGQNGFTLGGSTALTHATGDLRLYLNGNGTTLTGAYQNYRVKVYYRPSANENLEPKKRTQILYLKEKNISVAYN